MRFGNDLGRPTGTHPPQGMKNPAVADGGYNNDRALINVRLR
jgi:hypothetical protein